MFPFKQYTVINIRDKKISSEQYLLNVLEDAMVDSRMALTKRTENTIVFAKADIFKYPHPRNYLHNLTFEVKASTGEIQIKISTWNWEYFLFGVLFCALLLIDRHMQIIPLISILALLFIIMVAIKFYLLRSVKTAIEQVLINL